VSHFSGLNNWAIYKAQIDGDDHVRRTLGEIVAAARQMREALEGGRYRDVPAALDREWTARKALAEGVSTPEIERIVAAAKSEGGAAKVCGAGGGGMVIVWAEPDRRGSVETALKTEGFKPAPFRLDLRGLEVEEVA
jgi:D-glycero-alpha-D-manno-heptose-7-phosphate kinase